MWDVNTLCRWYESKLDVHARMLAAVRGVHVNNLQELQELKVLQLLKAPRLVFVTHLTFADGFNQALTEGVLPKTLTHLTFGISSIKH